MKDPKRIGQGRPGPGRPPGMRNKRTKEREAAMQAMAEALSDAIPDAFPGDAHALLVAVYKDPAQPMEMRLDAAKAAIRYETPALTSTTIDGTFRSDPDTLSDAQLARIASLGSAGVAEPPGDPAQFDDMVH